MPGNRLTSLDVFRGATIVAMIVVNNPGNWLAVYPQLQHASWNGCTLADLVFPFFIVIMGVALAFTVGREEADGRSSAVRWSAVLLRTAVLIAVGILLNAVAAWPALSSVRIPGVLQRIALTYLGAVIVLHWFGPRGQALLALTLLVAHWGALAGPFGSAGLAVDPAHNLAGRIDHFFFGQHLLTARGDPEGLLGVVPSIASALIGAMAGRWIQQRRRTPYALAAGLLAAGGVLVVLGLAWSTIWPFNKTLWSGSYVLFAGGMALGLIAATSLLVDGGGRHRWAEPLRWLGVNPLGIYVSAELVDRLLEMPLIRHGAMLVSTKDVLFWRWLVPFVRDNGGPRSSLIYALGYAGVWVLVAGLLHRRHIIIRV